jgi:aldehyde dehydrogenase (NAD+)
MSGDRPPCPTPTSSFPARDATMPDTSLHIDAPSLAGEVAGLLQAFGADAALYAGGTLDVRSPIDGTLIGQVRETGPEETQAAIGRVQAAFLAWRTAPAPRRGELVRLLGEELRAHKAALGRLVSIEAGKIV